MASSEELRSFGAELDRVVDRLNSMPLTRAATMSPACYAMAEKLLVSTRDLGGGIPDDARLPTLAPQGLGALIAVLSRDYLEAAKAAPLSDIRPMLDELIELRRSLP